jgi:sugar/nucleoside kinase (ribokinase family)
MHVSMRSLCVCPGLISVETFTAASQEVPLPVMERLFSLVDVFSPNEEEAVSMLKPQAKGKARASAAAEGDEGKTAAAAATSDPLLLTLPFLELGAKVVCLRRGSRGAVVHSSSGGAWAVPAVEDTAVVDTTGVCEGPACGGDPGF